MIPPAAEIDVRASNPDREARSDEYQPYKAQRKHKVPEFARAGDGYRFHTTGLTHDERGYPVMSAEVNRKRLCGPPRGQDPRTTPTRSCAIEEDGVEDADVVVVAYGITARVARHGHRDLARREKGIRRSGCCGRS